MQVRAGPLTGNGSGLPIAGTSIPHVQAKRPPHVPRQEPTRARRLAFSGFNVSPDAAAGSYKLDANEVIGGANQIRSEILLGIVATAWDDQAVARPLCL
jgi:hypothetical protein